jgi:hypothetical protein
MIMRTRISGEVRERLRQLVLARSRVLGLTPAAVEMLIGMAALERWAFGDEIAMSDETGHRLGFVVVGAARIVCETPRGRRVGVCFVPPGRFVGTGWPGDSPTGDGALRVVAHDPMGTIVAFWAPRTIVDVLGTLPAQHALQFVADAWQTANDVLRQKCHLLGLCLRDRVLAVLKTLAHDFGRPHGDGLRIDLRLTHLDLAVAAVGSRANVTRALEELRAQGLVAVDEHRLVVTRRGLEGFADEPRPARPWPEAMLAAQ